MNHTTKFGFQHLRTIFFFGLLILLGTTLLYLFRPFFYPILWAAIIAMIFEPLYERMNAHIKMPGISAILGVLLVVIMIFIPLVVLSILLVQQSVSLYNVLTIGGGGIVSNVQGLAAWLADTSLGPYIEEIRNRWTEYAASGVRAFSVFLFENIKQATQNSVRFLFLFFIMLFTLYHFFKDGKKILARLMHLSPLGDAYEKMLYDKFRSTSVATLKSTFIIGGVQGTIGGILFWITGVPGALVWGVVMMAFSILPALGSFMVWLPAGLIMLALGNVWQGVAILLVGIFIIATVDNLIRPPLLGKDTEMHPLIVLFSTLGGIFLFGVSGFIIGPIIAALFLAIISIYDHYYQSELSKG